jgi:hypothetical protein
MPFFIEIGVCDFETLLPLADNGWEGILVEPMKYYMDKLPRKENIYYENSCILPKSDIPDDKIVDIQYWDFDFIKSKGEEGEWMKGISSTDLHMNCFIANPQWNKYVKKTKINAISLDELILKYNVKQIDFLKIDIEGKDFDILNDYSFDIKPRLIKLESKFLHHKGWSNDTILTFFKKKGYIVYFEKDDLYAIR